jgi:hypothetical protein
MSFFYLASVLSIWANLVRLSRSQQREIQWETQLLERLLGFANVLVAHAEES